MSLFGPKAHYLLREKNGRWKIYVRGNKPHNRLVEVFEDKFEAMAYARRIGERDGLVVKVHHLPGTRRTRPFAVRLYDPRRGTE